MNSYNFVSLRKDIDEKLREILNDYDENLEDVRTSDFTTSQQLHELNVVLDQALSAIKDLMIEERIDELDKMTNARGLHAVTFEHLQKRLAELQRGDSGPK